MEIYLFKTDYVNTCNNIVSWCIFYDTFSNIVKYEIEKVKNYTYENFKEYRSKLIIYIFFTCLNYWFWFYNKPAWIYMHKSMVILKLIFKSFFFKYRYWKMINWYYMQIRKILIIVTGLNKCNLKKIYLRKLKYYIFIYQKIFVV